MFTRTPAAPPSLEDRSGSAIATAAAAISLFSVVVDDLEAASAEQLAVADEAQAEIDRLTEIAYFAEDEAVKASNAASKIRNLVA